VGAALAVDVGIKGVGIVAAAAAAGGAFVLPASRWRALSALAALTLTPVLVVSELWDSEQIRHLRDRPDQAAAAAIIGLALVIGLAVLFRRRPEALPLLAVLALPVRIPLATGTTSANLLVPLYAVVAGGVVAYAFERLWAPARTGEWRERRPGAVEIALAAFIVLYALQSLYSDDFEQAVKNVAFFYVPFALLLKLLTTVRWSRALVLRCFGLAAALALLFVLIGFWEYATRQLLWNRKVIESNQFESYFRVNSLFFDPNIYGRFLAIVMVGVASTLLWARRRGEVLTAAGVLALLWAGLIVTFSQSSFAALLVGLLALAAVRFDAWRYRWPLAATAVVLGAVLVAAGGALHVGSGRSLDRSSSGRLKLVRGGLEMFADRPLWGYGAGSFAERYREREKVGSPQAATASHTIPVTVAAEQGVVGLAAYAVVVLAAFRLLFAGLGRLRARSPPRRLVSRAFVAAGFATLVCHTLLYAAFLEDPIAWTLLGVGIVLARGLDPADEAPQAAQAPS
jgi:O-antigen ligase